MDAKLSPRSPINLHFWTSSNNGNNSRSTSPSHSQSPPSTPASPIKSRQSISSPRLEQLWRDIEKSMHLAKPHGEHKNMSEAKFQAGDMVLIDVVARSGAQQQIWGEVVRFKHSLFGKDKYEIRVIKKNVPRIVYDRSLETGNHGYIEQDAWLDVLKNTFEIIEDRDGIRLCKDDPERHHL